jgi:DNA-binding transcriptional LysR family regulator
LLRVGFTASSALNPVVAASIRAFRRAHGDVFLTLEEFNTMRLVASLHEGSLDAAFLRPGVPGCEALQLRLLSKPMLIALSESHPAAHRQEIDLGTLKNETFLLSPREYGPTLYDAVIAACRQAGFEPTISHLAPQIASIVALVAAELGVSVVPASMSQLRVTGVAYRPISGDSPKPAGAETMPAILRRGGLRRLSTDLAGALLPHHGCHPRAC